MASETHDPPHQRRDLLFLSALCFLCFFWRLGSAGLFDFNEGLYVQASREMVLRGDWVAGSVNGVLFFDKPPLAIWLCALSFQLFGFSELAARLPVAVASAALVFLTYFFGARYFDRRAGIIAASALALSPLFLGTARQMTMDIHQSLWFAVAMISFYKGFVAESAAGKRWYYGFWVGCGLAFLAKSVPGLFPLAACFLFLWIHERWKWRAVLSRILEAKPFAGILILIAIIAPWHVAAYLKYGDLFYQEYWILHHVALLKGTDFDHAQPFWYYAPALLGGMFPWSIFLVLAIITAWRGSESQATGTGESAARLFVLIWALSVLLIFSAMTSKLVSYLLPMYAAAALLVGDWLSKAVAAERKARGLVGGLTVISVLTVTLTGATAALLWRYTRPGVDIGGDFAPSAAVWVPSAIGALAVAAVVSVVLSLRKRPGRAVAAVIVGAFAFTLVAVEVGLKMIDREVNLPLRLLAVEAGSLASDQSPLAILIAGPRRPSVYFYLPDKQFERPMVERGEIEPIRQFLSDQRSAYVLTDRGRAAKLMAEVPDLREQNRSGKWVLLRAESVSDFPKLPQRPSP